MSSFLASPFLVLVLAVVLSTQQAAAFVNHHGSRTIIRNNPLVVLYGSDWSGFGFLEDDDDDDDLIDRREYAKEEDDQEVKAQFGATLDAPSIDDESTQYDPLFVPAGSQLELDEETVLRLLGACREEIGTLFGYTAENRGVGITGGVDYVELDGPVVVLRLKGRFWHERTTVLSRVSNYLQQRIPEIIDVTVEDEWQLTQEANEAF
mmetsp:Transcript_30398/g.71719  ORF Transcript_30398/g.71719 Transcript_30398/m.71719 type:complete len:207 (+) Transcript_30398:182-802(+)